MFEYEAQIAAVLDGDTLDCIVDLGFRMTTAQRFRLLGYNAPETRGPEAPLGRRATEILRGVLPVGSFVRVATEKGDAFGRWLARVELDDGSDLVTWLVDHGWGVVWTGKGSRPSFDPSAPYPLVQL